jgi:hypothetical protein
MPRGCRYSTSIHHTQYTNAERMQTLKLIQKLVQQPLLANKKCPSRGTALLEGSSNSSSISFTSHLSPLMPYTALLSCHTHCTAVMPYTALLSCHTLHCCHAIHTALLSCLILHCSHAIHCTAFMPYTALLSCHTLHCFHALHCATPLTCLILHCWKASTKRNYFGPLTKRWHGPQCSCTTSTSSNGGH